MSRFRYLSFVSITLLLFGIIGCKKDSSSPTQVDSGISISGFYAARFDSTTIILYWNQIPNADSIFILRGWGSRTPTDTIAKIMNVWNNYTDSDRRPDSSYSYRIIAQNSQDTAISSVAKVISYYAGIHYSNSIYPILTTYCGNCHSTNSQAGGWSIQDLSAAVNSRRLSIYYGTMTGSVIVLPGNPDQSALYTRISSTYVLYRMPFNLDSLAPGKVDTVRRWILEGATK